MSPIILFEPICRGSRLQILTNFIQAIRETSNRKIILVTRSDYLSPHFSELLGDVSNVIIEVAETDLSGAWIKSLSNNELNIFLNCLSVVIEENAGSDLYFMALDDYFKASISNLILMSKVCAKTNNYVLKYRVEYLLVKSNFKSLLLNYLTKLILFFLRGTLICFDERLDGMSILNRPIEIIPDPWFGNFSSSHRSSARNKYGFLDNEIIILAVGRQDKRKGIDTIIDFFPMLLVTNPNVKLFVVGKIDDKFTDEFTKLKKNHKNNIFHIDYFVDESELPIIFSCADIFILPYSDEFTSSSGTLSRALASGVPVVGSDHGLVGYRIVKNKLGFVFRAGNSKALNERINQLINIDDIGFKEFQTNGYLFCNKCSIERFMNRVNEVIFSKGAV